MRTDAHAGPPPIVVVGRGHSGTRLLARAVEALGVRLNGPERRGTADLQERWFTRRVKRLAERSLGRADPSVVPRPEAWWLASGIRRLRRVLSPEGDAWGWKFPETYLIPWHIERACPAARWIEIVRDGRDLAFKRHLTDDPDRRLGRLLLRRLDALAEPHHLQAARSWAFQVDRFQCFAAERPDRVHRLSFEDLLSRPHATVDEIAAFLGRPVTPACRELLDTGVKRGKLRQHRGQGARAIAQVEATIGPALRRHGYQVGAGRGSRLSA